MTARRFTGTNHALRISPHAAQIRFVNGSRMVSAWSGSCPSVNGFIINQNRHREFSINGINTLPASGDGQKGINDSDTLVKQDNFGSVKNQISHARNSNRPGESWKQFTWVSPKKNRNGHHDAHDVNHNRHNQIAVRSENLNVCHSAILAQFTRTAA